MTCDDVNWLTESELGDVVLSSLAGGPLRTRRATLRSKKVKGESRSDHTG